MFLYDPEVIDLRDLQMARGIIPVKLNADLCRALVVRHSRNQSDEPTVKTDNCRNCGAPPSAYRCKYCGT